MVLALDPASYRMGWAVAAGPTLVAYGVLQAPRRASLGARLHFLVSRLEEIVSSYSVQIMAVEAVHARPGRTQAALQLARVSGVLELFAFQKGLPILFVPATRARQAVVGQGRASKEEVRDYLCQHYGLPEDVALDASDACLIALYATTYQKRSATPERR